MSIPRFPIALLSAAVALISTPDARASWLESASSGSVAYFLHDGPGRILRYDMTLAEWLDPITLSGVPTAFAVDSEGIYVGFGQTVSRMALDGTRPTALHDTRSTIEEIAVNGPYLYLVQSSDVVTSIHKASGVEIDEENYFYSFQGVSIAPSVGKLFARNFAISTPDIVQITLGTDGSLGAQDDAPYHGDYPDATRTFVFPGDALVADNSGIVYDTSDLSFANGLGGALDDLSFYGNLPIVLRGNTIHAYDDAFLPTGQHTVATEIDRIFVHKETVYGFGGTTVMSAVATPIDALSPLRPGAPVDPNGLAYSPISIALGTDGVVYLLSNTYLSIFRWSIAEGTYLPTIPLARAPTFMAYSSVSRRLYLAYPGGLLTRIDLDELNEVPFANSPQTPCGLATAGAFLFVCDPSADTSHFTYHPSGSLISQVDGYYSTEYIWNEVNRRMYFMRDGHTPNDLLWEAIDVDGVIGEQQDSPYHGDAEISHPIRVSPDGTAVVAGSGWIFNGISLTHSADLANSIADADWLQGQLFSLRLAAPYAEIQRWATLNYLLEHSFFVNGLPLRLFALDDELLVISSVNGIPRFWLRGPDAGDVDRDGVADHLDTCPELANDEQIDTDGDGEGDACNDAHDADGDEWSDVLDTCPDVENPTQDDGDGDGLGDDCDPFPLHDLRIVFAGPDLGLTAVPVSVTFRLEDAAGRLLSDLTDVRVRLELGGSAIFGADARTGLLIRGSNTNNALVEFDSGLLVIPIVDPVAESVRVTAVDTEVIGITLSSGLDEDFETDDGGFTHYGANDSWAHGVPSSGPGQANSGTRVWATNLNGHYSDNSDCSLQTPAVTVLPEAASLTFQSWFDSQSCCDRGYVEISDDGGSSWTVLDTLGGFDGGYDALSYDLFEFAGSTVVVRLRLVSDGSDTDFGWYVDDFQLGGTPAEIRFIAPDGDDDADGSTNADELATGTDPFDADSDDDLVLDGVDNCALVSNPSQADAVHPNGQGDACDDPDTDGIVDAADNCPDLATLDQSDSVHPGGLGDACADPDADGVVDLADNCPDHGNASQLDEDRDLVGSDCDICPATYNPAQTETAACMVLTGSVDSCLEASIELIGEDVSGQLQVHTGVGSVPTSLTFDILAGSCSLSDELFVELNGQALGSVVLDPAHHCSCLSPIQRLTVDDAELLGSAWSIDSPNVIALVKRGASSALSWVRLTIEGEHASQQECVYSNGPSGCTMIDLCAGGFTFAPIDHEFELAATTGQILSAAAFAGSQLPDLLAIGDSDSADALCVVTSSPSTGRDCLPIAPMTEQFIAINGAACITPALGTDVLVDFGAGAGIFIYQDDEDWIALHERSPEEVATGDLDGDGSDESVFCFAGDDGGLYVWSAERGWWPRLLPMCGGGLVTGDLDGNAQDELIVDLSRSGAGLYAWFNDSFWLKLHDLGSEQLATADLDDSGRDELIVDFGSGPGLGLYVLYDASSWVRLHALSPESVAVGDLEGSGLDDLIVDFGSGFGLGLFAYHDDAYWTSVHELSPEAVTAGDVDGIAGDELIVDFGPGFGVYLRSLDSSWVALHELSPELMATADVDRSGKDELIVDFGDGPGLGLYLFREGAAWSGLHPLSPELVVTGELNPPR